MKQLCRSCKAEVIFVPSATSGKAMILDANPEKRVVLIESGLPHGYTITTPDDPDARAKVVDVYTDHHVTCPDAERWRGRTRRDPAAPEVPREATESDAGRSGGLEVT